MFDFKTVSAKVAPNIAVIKYWGKSDEVHNFPLNSSISLTLDNAQLYTETSVQLTDEKDHCLILNNEPVNPFPDQMKRIIDRSLELSSADEDGHWKRFKVHSRNSFPVACGLASSASSMCAFALALAPFFKLDGRSEHVAELARVGSGSAIRSLLGGFVKWNSEPPSMPVQLFQRSHWPAMRIMILMFQSCPKKTSSRKGMKRSRETSLLLKARLDHCQKLIESMERSIEQKDFASFARHTMQDSNRLHAICLETYPPLFYMNDYSHHLIEFVHLFNEASGDQEQLAYTFDAGANGFLFMLDSTVLTILNLLAKSVRAGGKRLDVLDSIDNELLRLTGKGSVDERASAGLELSQAIEAFVPGIERLLFSDVGDGPIVNKSPG